MKPNKDKRIYCNNCTELTFRTPDESVFICQGCGSRTPRKRITNRMVNIDEVDENLLVEKTRVNSESVENLYSDVLGRFHKLSEMERRAIELLMEGKTQEEAAKILSISRGEISTYLNRAKTKLK